MAKHRQGTARTKKGDHGRAGVSDHHKRSKDVRALEQEHEERRRSRDDVGDWMKGISPGSVAFGKAAFELKATGAGWRGTKN